MNGKRFSRLVVLYEAGNVGGKLLWRCACDCGNEITARGESLLSNNTKSCGCLQRDKASSRSTTHGKARTLTHRIWCGILTRCTNTKHHSYSRYGARGISVCDRWRSFEAFLEDMGECPAGLTIERIDNNGNYCPGNCKWATPWAQVRNTSRTHLISFNGETLCLTDWAKRLGIVNASLRRRLRSWPLEIALTKTGKRSKR